MGQDDRKQRPPRRGSTEPQSGLGDRTELHRCDRPIVRSNGGGVGTRQNSTPASADSLSEAGGSFRQRDQVVDLVDPPQSVSADFKIPDEVQSASIPSLEIVSSRYGFYITF